MCIESKQWWPENPQLLSALLASLVESKLPLALRPLQILRQRCFSTTRNLSAKQSFKACSFSYMANGILQAAKEQPHVLVLDLVITVFGCIRAQHILDSPCIRLSIRQFQLIGIIVTLLKVKLILAY